MLFKLQKTEKGDFLAAWKILSLIGIVEFYIVYIICANIPYDQAEYISKLSYP